MIIILSPMQKATYEGIQQGKKLTQIAKELGVRVTTISNCAIKLHSLRAVEKRGKFYSPTTEPVEIVLQKRKFPTTRNRFGIIRNMMRSYGADNIRYIWYQRNIADIEKLSEKTKVHEKDLLRIMNYMDKLSA